MAVSDLRLVRGTMEGYVDPEKVKYAWDDLCGEAGVELLHHVYGCTVVREGDAAAGVVAETRAGRRAYRAKRVIDCTGDGIVAAQAGVPWDQGDGEHAYAMALTKVFRLGGVGWPDGPATPEELDEIERRLDEAIARGEFTTPVILEKKRLLNYIRGRRWQLRGMRPEMMSILSRVLEVDPLDPRAFSAAEREGRDQAWEAAEVYRHFVPGAEKAYLLDTSAQIGVRSSRRLRGVAAVSDVDVLEFRKHPDGIARGTWDIDIWPADDYGRMPVKHDSDTFRKRRARLTGHGEYYHIRYGCLVAEGVDNLFMAGRCISCSHVAQSSLRIQQTCMATGQAAGVAAAISISEGVSPRKLDPAKMLPALTRQRDVEPAFDLLKHIPIANVTGG